MTTTPTTHTPMQQRETTCFTHTQAPLQPHHQSHHRQGGTQRHKGTGERVERQGVCMGPPHNPPHNSCPWCLMGVVGLCQHPLYTTTTFKKHTIIPTHNIVYPANPPSSLHPPAFTCSPSQSAAALALPPSLWGPTNTRGARGPCFLYWSSNSCPYAPCSSTPRGCGYSRWSTQMCTP